MIFDKRRDKPIDRNGRKATDPSEIHMGLAACVLKDYSGSTTELEITLDTYPQFDFRIEILLTDQHMEYTGSLYITRKNLEALEKYIRLKLAKTPEECHNICS